MHQCNCACTCVQGKVSYLPGQGEAISYILSINLGLWKEGRITDLRPFQKVAKKNSSTNEVSQFGPWVMHSFLFGGQRDILLSKSVVPLRQEIVVVLMLCRLTFSMAEVHIFLAGGEVSGSLPFHLCRSH